MILICLTKTFLCSEISFSVDRSAGPDLGFCLKMKERGGRVGNLAIASAAIDPLGFCIDVPSGRPIQFVERDPFLEVLLSVWKRLAVFSYGVA
jgi:hypothetical protein